MDVVSESLRNIDSVKLENTDLRMLDFAKLGASIEKSMGLSEGGFLETYSENHKNIRRLILDNNLVVTLLLRFMKDKSVWEGISTELYENLEGMTNYSNQKKFPKSCIGLTNVIERLGKNLLEEGIKIEKDREGGTGKRLIKIINLNYNLSHSSHSSQNQTGQQPLSF